MNREVKLVAIRDRVEKIRDEIDEVLDGLEDYRHDEFWDWYDHMDGGFVEAIHAMKMMEGRLP